MKARLGKCAAFTPHPKIVVLAAVLAWLGASLVSGRAEGTAPDPAAAGIKRLQEGNARYISGQTVPGAQDAARRAELAHGQKPFAVVVSCADSRVGPEVIFDQGLGDIFVIRSAGEVVDDVGLGSIEYGVAQLGAPLVLVLGHNRCGAVAAAVAGGEAPGHLPAVLDAIKPAVARAKEQPGDLMENAVLAQVRAVVEQLRNSEPVLAGLVKSGRVAVVGACYDLESGRVEFLDQPSSPEPILGGESR